MSLISQSFDCSVIVRAADAETVARAPTNVHLLADASSTGGALSTVGITIERGADGAKPPLHKGSAEMFSVLDGSVLVLSGQHAAVRSWRDSRLRSSRLIHMRQGRTSRSCQ